jgi:hypothetical protein
MAFPVVTVEVAFTTNPAATPAWTDITAYLLELTVNRGRRDEFSRFPAGSARITLANEDRRFDPTNTAGPYSPNVLPMRRVRVRAVYNAVTYDIFNGYADGWEQSYQHPAVSTCVLGASDAFKVLANIVLPSSPYVVEVAADSPVAWYRLGEPVGADQFVDSIGTKHLTIGATPELGVAGLTVRDTDTAVTFTADTQGAERIGAPTVTGPPMTFEMIYRGPAPSGRSLYGEVNSAVTAGWSVEEFGANLPRMAVLTPSGAGSVTATTTLDTTAPHHLAFTWAADGTLKAYVDGIQEASVSVVPGVFDTSVYAILGGGSTGTSGAPALAGTYDEVAIYNTVLSPTRIAAHAAARATGWAGELSGARINRILDAAGWPATDRDIDTGTSTVQGANLATDVLSVLQKVEEAEQGRLYVTASGLVRFLSRDALIQAPYTTSQATFGDSGAELEYADLVYRYDDAAIWNDIVVSRADGLVQQARDLTSEAKYLRRTRTVDGLILESDATTLDLANWILAHYKDPVLRATDVRLEPDAGNEVTHFPQVLGRELVDRVTVLRRPQSVGAAINQETLLEGVRHRVRGLSWKTDWNLSPADTQVYGVWDSPTALWDVARWSY